MSYTKKTWASGDTVTSAALNNMEGGIDAAANPFIVTLTPTAQDFSGVMDKTVGEITEAYESGKKIVFKMYTSETTFIEVPVSLVGYDLSDTYPSFETSVIQLGNNLLIYARTGVTSGGTNNLYYTTIFPLTPM